MVTANNPQFDMRSMQNSHYSPTHIMNRDADEASDTLNTIMEELDGGGGMYAAHI